MGRFIKLTQARSKKWIIITFVGATCACSVWLTKNGRAQLVSLVKKDGQPVEFEYSERKGIQR